MAKFVQSAEMTEYFDALNRSSTTGKIANRLEQWWLCAQVGLITGQTGDSPGTGSSDMVDYFIKSMEDSQTRIRGLFLVKQFEKVDAGGLEREILEAEIQRLLSVSDSRLSDDSTKLLDKYATGGLEIIKEEIGKKEELYVFMMRYHELVKRAVSEKWGQSSISSIPAWGEEGV